MAHASWAPASAAASSLWSSIRRPGPLPPRLAGPFSSARQQRGVSWHLLERLLVPAAAAAVGGHPRAELLGSRLDVSRRGRGRAADHRPGVRLEADRGAAPAARATWTPIDLVSNGVPASRPLRPRLAADRRSFPGHQRLAQRQPPRGALRGLRSLRLRPDAISQSGEPARPLL